MGKNGPVHIIIYKTGENGPAYINVYQLLDKKKRKWFSVYKRISTPWYNKRNGSDRDSYNMFNKGWESFSKPPSLFQHYSMLEWDYIYTKLTQERRILLVQCIIILLLLLLLNLLLLGLILFSLVYDNNNYCWGFLIISKNKYYCLLLTSHNKVVVSKLMNTENV